MKKTPKSSQVSGLQEALKNKVGLQQASSERAKAASLAQSNKVIEDNLCIDPERVKLLQPAFGRKIED